MRRDRSGYLKTDEVVLHPEPGGHAHADPKMPPPGLDDKEWRWVLAASSRRWASIEKRWGARSWPLAVSLLRAGVVTVTCAAADLRLGPPLRWRLTSAWNSSRTATAAARTEVKAEWKQRAVRASELVGELDDGLSMALTAGHVSDAMLQVLVHAAEDLTAGVAHDGPRAFSQAHFGQTKARDDAADILLTAGVHPESVTALGLRRSPYLGLGGQIRLELSDQAWDFRGVHGPVQLRADQPMTASICGGPSVLLVIENLQAAEAVCDSFGDVAVLWTAGQPSRHTVRILSALAADAAEIIIATDADLGGVRITARIWDALHPGAPVDILDCGALPHQCREPFGAVSRAGLRSYTNRTDLVGDFARAVEARDHPVEQEHEVRSAIVAALSRRGGIAATGRRGPHHW